MNSRVALTRISIQLRRLRSSDGAIAFTVGLLFSLVFSYPILAHLTFPGSDNDWDFSFEMAWTPYYTIRHFHQIPLWNPYKCGGLPMLANPQSRILTPMFLLQLVCGPVLGLHLEIILHLALAWAGGYLLGRTLGMTRLGAVGAATLFPASSWFYLHLGEGHAVMLPFAYLPWLALCLWRAFESRGATYAIAAGAILALMFGEGGVYAVTYSILVAGVLAFAVAFLKGSLQPLLELSISGLFAAGFAAVKLLPSRSFVDHFPRLIGNGYSTDWRVLGIALFSPDQDKLRVSPGGFGFHEYGAYVGIGFGLLALCAMLAPLRKTAPWLLAAGVVFCAVAWRKFRVRLLLMASTPSIPHLLVGAIALAMVYPAGLHDQRARGLWSRSAHRSLWPHWICKRDAPAPDWHARVPVDRPAQSTLCARAAGTSPNFAQCVVSSGMGLRQLIDVHDGTDE